MEIDCRAPDDELLLVHWLNAVNLEIASRQMLFARLDVHFGGHRLHGRAMVESLSVARHHPAVEVKGATCSALRVAPQDGGWRGQTVVDV